jgi:NAD(P)-dependent dehydrogenase (short-subunit alcohol dehydrogenase family)
MEHKVCLVTGATSGIGKETARGLLRLGATVVITARDAQKGAAVLAELQPAGGRAELLVLDLSSLASVRAAAAEFQKRFDRLDVLVNNAGASLFTRQVTADGYEANFATNHLGPFLLTRLLGDLLKRSAPSRVITVASSALAPLDFSDLMSEKAFDPMTVYSRTKAANILFTGELARRWAGTGVTVNCVHPGVVKTSLVRDARGPMKVLFALFRPFFVKPEQGADNSVYLASSPDVEGVTGAYFVGRKSAPTPYLTDTAAQKALWEASEKLTS